MNYIYIFVYLLNVELSMYIYVILSMYLCISMLSYLMLHYVELFLYYIAYNNYYIPVVPHKAVAEVSKIGNL